jgi:hypothetical protein
MLADRSTNEDTGRIEAGVLLPGTARHGVIEFIAQQLPCWRDHPERPSTLAEPMLTDQLCDHLNTAAGKSTTWDYIQFRTEVPDEVNHGRKIDLAAKPRATTLIIGGMRYTQFRMLLPIECKRLPTPREKGRDEREYVVTEPGTTGGIQRFKFGHHGAAHNLAAMIAYVQEQSHVYWVEKVNSWIRDLAMEDGASWSASDLLQPSSEDPDTGLCMLRSRHKRAGDLGECELRHLWIKMN